MEKITIRKAVILLNEIDKKQEFTVQFIKKYKKELRTMKCIKNMQAIAYNPVINHLLPVFDIDNKGYRNVNLNGLIYLELNKIEYEVVS